MIAHRFALRIPFSPPRVQRLFWLSSFDPAAFRTARLGWLDLKQNAAALWRAAELLGLSDALLADHANDVRARGGLIGSGG